MLWLALGASFFFLRAGENFVGKDRRWDNGHISRRGDGIFFRGSTQLDWTMWGQADGFEVRFRSSKGDQLLDRMVMSCARAGPPLPLRGQGGAIELIIELLSSCMFLPSHAPLAAFGTERGKR